jgi:Protein of unknown function DUF262
MDLLTQIPQLSGKPTYRTDVQLSELPHTLERYLRQNLQIDPDFQRGHVWNPEQKQKWIEFLLRGGKSADILLNQPGWMNDFSGEFTLVDGKQRLTACLEFLENKIAVFPGMRGKTEGWTASEIHTSIVRAPVIGIAINNLKTRKELLQWYLELNEGHVAHKPEDLEKVRELIAQENIPTP